MKYFVLAYYIFTEIEDPYREVKNHKRFFKERDATGRIYISEEGINGQMSAAQEDAEAYMTWLREDPRFSSVEFKIHLSEENVFPRMTVKTRKQLVALDVPADPNKGGKHLSAQEWDAMLDSRDDNTILIDVRNDYEWKIGHFEGAVLPKLEKFRQFPQYVKDLKKERDPKKTKVMMCCTGGIRCELFSHVMKEEGFDEVYQLDGGIIKYGQQVGSSHFRGKLFVFDDRLSISIGANEPEEIISHCYQCDAKTDSYFNCANMDCNELFLACPKCAEKMKGCCSHECTEAARIRKLDTLAHPKPFRRAHECSLL